MIQERYLLQFSMKAEGDEAEVMIYSAISSEPLWGDETTPGDFDKALKGAVKKGIRKLCLRINSPGGEVWAAVAMRSMVINAGFDSVRVMIEGLCASAATLFATIPGARVVIAAGSEFMIHNPRTVAFGDAREMDKTADHLRKMEIQFSEMYAGRSGQTTDQIRAWMDEETWFTAKEACETGFCDELLETEQAAACVSPRSMAVMRAMYQHVPDTVTEEKDSAPFDEDGPSNAPGVGGENVSHDVPVAGASSEIHHEEEHGTMEIKDLNVDQLRAENPALFDSIRESALADERQRVADIDALTLPGYEAMAAEAKANGTTALDFQKQIVAAMRQKGADYLQNRQKETEPAKDVRDGASGESEDAEMAAFAKEIKAYADSYQGRSDGGMF